MPRTQCTIVWHHTQKGMNTITYTHTYIKRLVLDVVSGTPYLVRAYDGKFGSLSHEILSGSVGQSNYSLQLPPPLNIGQSAGPHLHCQQVGCKSCLLDASLSLSLSLSLYFISNTNLSKKFLTVTQFLLHTLLFSLQLLSQQLLLDL